MLWWFLPLSGAAFGYAALALPMFALLHPARPVRLGPWRVQGLLPGLRPELARQTLMSLKAGVRPEELAAVAASPAVIQTICEATDRVLAEQLDKLGESLPSMVSGMYNGKIKGRLLEAASSRLSRKLPGLITEMSGQLVQELDLDQLLRDKVDRFFDQDFERITHETLGKLPWTAPLATALLGLAVGLLQALALS